MEAWRCGSVARRTSIQDSSAIAAWWDASLIRALSGHALAFLGVRIFCGWKARRCVSVTTALPFCYQYVPAVVWDAEHFLQAFRSFSK